MKRRAWLVLGAAMVLATTACGGDDGAAELAEAEQQIAELQAQLDAATSTTTLPGETTSTVGGGSDDTGGAATTPTTSLPAGAYPVPTDMVCVIGSTPGEEVNVRSGPGSEFEVVGTLPEDATGVQVTGWGARDVDGDEWRQIVFEDATAWVYSPLLTPWACTLGEAVDYCVNEDACTDTPNVRTGLGTGYAIIDTLATDAVGIQGTGATTLDDHGRTWVQIRQEGGVGWVAGWLLNPEPCSPTDCPPPPLPWVITAEAVGPIELGMPLVGLGEATGFSWSFTEDCAVGCLTGHAPGLGVVIFAHEGTVVDEIDVYEAGDAVTGEGLEVGDSLATLQGIYGSRVLEIGDDGFGGTAVWIDTDDDGEADLVALVHSSNVTTIRLPAVLSEGCC
jgi:uncharacterized protein YraI